MSNWHVINYLGNSKSKGCLGLMNITEFFNRCSGNVSGWLKFWNTYIYIHTQFQMPEIQVESFISVWMKIWYMNIIQKKKKKKNTHLFCIVKGLCHYGSSFGSHFKTKSWYAVSIMSLPHNGVCIQLKVILITFIYLFIYF